MEVLGRHPAHQGEGAALAGEAHPVRLVVGEAEPRERGDRGVERLGGGDIGHADPEVVDSSAAPQRSVVHGLCAVAVRVEQEAAVVVVAVGAAARGGHRRGSRPPRRRARSRRPARAWARRSRCAGAGSVGGPRPPRRTRTPATRELVGAAVDAERRQHGAVEAVGGRPVRHPDRDVVEHVRPGSVRARSRSVRPRPRGAAGRRGRQGVRLDAGALQQVGVVRQPRHAELRQPVLARAEDLPPRAARGRSRRAGSRRARRRWR